MQPATAQDLAFLAPGLAHQFGNLLLTIQGHALYLDADVVQRVKPVILHACERGSGALRILRHVLGGCETERADGAPTLLQVMELLRIPVREAGHTLACPVAPPNGIPVDLASFVPLAVGMVRALVHAVPAGVRGAVELGMTAEPGPTLRLHFRPLADSLPFPLGWPEVLRPLQAQIGRRGWAHRLEGAANGLVLHLPRATSGLQA